MLINNPATSEKEVINLKQGDDYVASAVSAQNGVPLQLSEMT